MRVIFDEGLETQEIVDDGFAETLIHVVCQVCYPGDADPRLALCGSDMTNEQNRGDSYYLDEIDCIVCHELDPIHHCPRRP